MRLYFMIGLTKLVLRRHFRFKQISSSRDESVVSHLYIGSLFYHFESLGLVCILVCIRMCSRLGCLHIWFA